MLNGKKEKRKEEEMVTYKGFNIIKNETVEELIAEMIDEFRHLDREDIAEEYKTKLEYIKNQNIKIGLGDRVKVFDSLLFENDITTPLSVTMVKGTVTKVYKDNYGRECVDVLQDRIRFPHLKGVERHMSRGHFIWGVEHIFNWR